jgi:ribonuclease-3
VTRPPEELARRLGIASLDPELLRQALTHRSLHGDDPPPAHLWSNERLEFLGDAALGLAIASYLYRQHPRQSEGALTQFKAVAVSEVTLGRIARRIGLGDYVLISQAEEQSGGRDRTSILADAVEALIGAVFLDHGYVHARRLVLKLFKDELPTIERDARERDYKTVLQELTQEQTKAAPVYRVVEETGPDHDKRFVVEALLGDDILGAGAGRSKKEAEQAAARQALERRRAEADD